ncbi:MAG: hypothetical protein GQ565_13775 [Candidatus Aegiribacteria sp.]|nr:hypothetical protein [Candidatus Aegiribacteria sp.]
MSTRTIERYRKIFRETELAGKVMNDVTNSLVDLLDLNVTEQRLDSTHVFSNMAAFGRTRLMGVTVKRFLTQVKRHGAPIYESLPEELRMRSAITPGRQRYASTTPRVDTELNISITSTSLTIACASLTQQSC